MVKNILLLLMLVLLGTACAVRRPLFSPHRPNNQDHRQATTIAQCLECHTENIPHDKGRGDCLKCHRVLEGE
jgi:uncharacterized paraquat-inducible protein A